MNSSIDICQTPASSAILSSSRERGATSLLLIVFVLPVLFFIFSISMDVNVYLNDLQRVQKIVDDAALYSYRFLPYREAAISAACSYTKQHKVGEQPLECGNQIEVTVPQDGSSITVIARASSQLFLATYFGVEAGIPLEAFAAARGTPYDVLVAMDTSSYLAPDVLQGQPWGGPSQWPAANFFSMHPLYNQGQQVDKQLLTQQCSNPVFNALKGGVLSSYEYLASNGINAVGVAFYPGSFGGVEVARDVLPRLATSDQVTFTPYERMFNSNTFCLAAAENDPTGSPNAFPVANQKFAWSGEDDPLRPSPIVIPGSWEVNPEYMPFFRTREVVWGQAAREKDSPDSHGDIGVLLSEVRARLIGSIYVGSRGGMANTAIKSAIIFAGDVPRSAGVRYQAGNYVESLINSQIGSLKLELAPHGFKMVLYYVLLEHDAVNDGSFSERKQQLGELFASLSDFNLANGASLELRLISGSDTETLVDEVVAGLLLDKRRVVLAQ